MKFLSRFIKGKKSKQSRSADARTRKLTRKQNKKKLKAKARQKTLPSTWKLAKGSLGQIKDNKKLFTGILLVYTFLIVIFIRGVSGNFQLDSIKQTVDFNYSEESSKWEKGLASYGLLLGSAVETPSEVESVYQTISVVIISLALIWAIRQTYAKDKNVLIRDSFYKGMYPLVPFLLVMFTMFIFLMPFLITSTIYSDVQSGSIAITGSEQFLWKVIVTGGGLISAYLVLSTIFALYISTLPNMRPAKAIKEAFALVRFRRWQISKKFIILIIFTLVVSAAVLIPLIVFFPKAAEIIYILFSMLFIVFMHTFIYRMYRELI